MTKKTKILDLHFFFDFEVWVKDSKVFDVRFGFLVKNCVYFSEPPPKVDTLKI